MKNLLSLALSIITFSVHSAVLIPEQGVSVLFIDGVATESSIGNQTINSGTVDIIVRMDKELGRGNSAKAYTSPPYVLKLNVTGEEVKILLPQARSVQEAEKAFRDNEPKWTILQDGKEAAYQQEILPPKEGLFPYLGMNTLVSDYYKKKNKDVTAEQAVVSLAPGINTTSATSNLVQLKAWYLKSSTEERKAFRRWMIDQE
ncbi:DUF2057 family protein [Vibrio plantisponsor]|uniref:DUF2057 family protein n=1 Tax=Vibrio plantisponsor TaxID=664643 RepID=A0ABU4IDK1_9VIBR|nr:DUF2057 family protein [Vibrio plantisponsor]MDW6016623.1 DUF2057 family protein [Vibrio plantisponsor]NNM40006.1 DUF2057 family protein [Vibrio plantisponsor]